MGANRLELNADKTEFMWCGSQRRIGQLPNEPFVVCGSSVTPSTVVRDLGVWIDSGLSMSTHISKTVAGCFATLCQLRSVRRSLSRDSLTRLAVALVLSRLDYCNGVLAGLPAANSTDCSLSSMLQRDSSAAPADAIARSHDDYTDCLFLSVWSSNCVLTYRCLHGLGPDYLFSDIASVSDFRPRQLLYARRLLQLCLFLLHDAPHLATGRHCLKVVELVARAHHHCKHLC